MSFAFPQLTSLPNPPALILREIQQRVVLLINHVLQQEPEAMQRLAKHKSSIISAEYAQLAIKIIVTPAGLIDLAPSDKTPSLTLRVKNDNPWELFQGWIRGNKPPVEIAGDVILAAEINWLVEHVRWDIEDDLARIVGEVPAYHMMQFLHESAQVLRRFVFASSNIAEQGLQA